MMYKLKVKDCWKILNVKNIYIKVIDSYEDFQSEGSQDSNSVPGPSKY